MSRALAAWLLLAASAAIPTTTPRDVVHTAVTRVITVLKEARANRGAPAPDTMPDRDRTRTEIRRIAMELFDFKEVSRRALVRYWAGRTRDDQIEFVGLFTDLLERSYVGKIEAYSGEKIAYTGDSVDGDYASVRSRIITKSRNDTSLDYRLDRVDGHWKVYDVLIDGVSFVSTYRSQFDHIIQSSSYNELIDRLRKKQIEIRTVRARG
jgi:phospholipid transport system substrate-binding protein